jgi:regulator of sigma D
MIMYNTMGPQQQLHQCEQIMQQLVQQTQQGTAMYQQLLQQEQQNASSLENLVQRERNAAQMIQTAIQHHQQAVQQCQQVIQLCNQLENTIRSSNQMGQSFPQHMGTTGQHYASSGNMQQYGNISQQGMRSTHSSM